MLICRAPAGCVAALGNSAELCSLSCQRSRTMSLCSEGTAALNFHRRAPRSPARQRFQGTRQGAKQVSAAVPPLNSFFPEPWDVGLADAGLKLSNSCGSRGLSLRALGMDASGIGFSSKIVPANFNPVSPANPKGILILSIVAGKMSAQKAVISVHHRLSFLSPGAHKCCR